MSQPTIYNIEIGRFNYYELLIQLVYGVVCLQLVLHFWSDEDCVKILEQCKKAIPSREEGGKVIVIEILLGPYMGPIMYEAQLLMDMLMMVNTRGRQRTKNDWRQIFTKAGFSDYKIVKKIGARGVIEVYP